MQRKLLGTALPAAAFAAFLLLKPVVEGRMPMPGVPAALAQESQGACKERSWSEFSSKDTFGISRVRSALGDFNPSCENKNTVIEIMEMAGSDGGGGARIGFALGSILRIVQSEGFQLSHLAIIRDLIKAGGPLAPGLVISIGRDYQDEGGRQLILSPKFAGTFREFMEKVSGSPERDGLLRLLCPLLKNGGFSLRQIANERLRKRLEGMSRRIRRDNNGAEDFALGAVAGFAEMGQFELKRLDGRLAAKAIRLAKEIARKNAELGIKQPPAESLLEYEIMDEKVLDLLIRGLKRTKQSPEKILSSLSVALNSEDISYRTASRILKKSTYPAAVFDILLLKARAGETEGSKAEPRWNEINQIIGFAEYVGEKTGSGNEATLDQCVELLRKSSFDMGLLEPMKKLAAKSGRLGPRALRAWSVLLEKDKANASGDERLLDDLTARAMEIESASGGDNAPFELWYRLLSDQETRTVALENPEAMKAIAGFMKLINDKWGPEDSPLPSFESLISAKGFPYERMGALHRLLQIRKDVAGGVFGALCGFVSNPGFRPEMLEETFVGKLAGFIDSVRDMEGKEPELAYSDNIGRILGQAAFRPHMLDGIAHIIRKGSAKRIGPQLRGVSGILESMMEKSGFRPSMLKDLEFLIEKSGADSWIAMEYADAILGRQDFRAEMLGRKKLERIGATAKLVSSGIRDGMDNILAMRIKEVLECPRAGADMQELILRMAQNGADGLDMYYLTEILSYPKYGPHLAMAIRIVAEGSPDNYGESLGHLTSIIRRDDFRPDFIRPETIRWVGEMARLMETGGTGKGHLVSRIIERAFSNPKVTPLNIVQAYNDAKEFARSIGADYQDPEVCFNFLYGISVIGKGRVSEMHRRLGIEYFARYPKKTLDYTYESLNRMNNFGGRPLLFVMYNKSDWNGAFYSNEIDQIREKGHYRIIVAEASGRKDFTRMANAIGYHGKVEAMIVGGHGSPDAVHFGNGTNDADDSGYLNLSDEKVLAPLKRIFANSPLIVMESCSTGQDENAIGAMLSRVFGARTFAPKVPSNISEMIFDGNGSIKAVKYTTEQSEFDKGKLVPTPPEFYK